MNPYFNFERIAVPETIVDAFDYNYEMVKIGAAFDLVPPASQLLSGTLNYSPDTGSASAYQTMLLSIPSGVPYEKGNNVALLVANTAIGPSELQVNDKGFVPVKVAVFDDTVAGDLIAGGIFTFVYDGDKFQTLEMSPRYLQVSIDKAADAADSAADSADSAADAADSAADANSSAALAATFVTPSANSASAAAGSASAGNSASAAAGSASAAAGSATSAAGSASTAGNRESSAAGSATAAANSATASGNSATAAAGSATAAANSATAADEAADEAEDRFSDPAFLQMVRELIVDIEYPVGAIETFAVNDDPNDMYPWTTWVAMEANRTLRAAQTTTDIGQMIGSDSISLLAAHLPAHNHTVNNATTSSYDYASKALNNLDLGSKTTSSFNYGTKTTTSFDYGTKSLNAFDYGTKTSSSNGAHAHTFKGPAWEWKQALSNGPYERGINTVTTTTSTDGAHAHTVEMGTHNHSVPVGSHAHNVAIGSHTHAAITVGSHAHNVAIGSHTHSATATIASFGSGQAFSVVNSHIKVRAWHRTE